MLKWLNSESSRAALGYEETIRRPERLRLNCHPPIRSNIRAGLAPHLPAGLLPQALSLAHGDIASYPIVREPPRAGIPGSVPPAAPWPRAERLDPRRMTEAIREAAGVALRIDGPCPGGQTGAAYVSWPDGHRSVLTFRPGTTLARMREGPLAVLGTLRRSGYPAPAAELAVQADHWLSLAERRTL